MPKRNLKVSGTYTSSNHLTLRKGNCLRFLRSLPDKIAQLVVTSPPYNIGKEYESRMTLQEYLELQRAIIVECLRITKDGGSICWQVGNYCTDGEIVPLDILVHPIFASLSDLKLRNRIIWKYESGLHCSKRFSGRYESIMWYTKGNDYVFNLDPVRVPQKYPGKTHTKGSNRGKPSCNPLGKNPGDIWEFPVVKSNHVEKTEHPCQFPIGLVENLVLSLTNRNHLVVDPFLGSGTTAIAALKNGRRALGVELDEKYIRIIKHRVRQWENGELPYRDRKKPILKPTPNTKLTTIPKRKVA